jgi:hypothetical protein
LSVIFSPSDKLPDFFLQPFEAEIVRKDSIKVQANAKLSRYAMQVPRGRGSKVATHS